MPEKDLVVFIAGKAHFTAADVLDAAWFRGDLPPLWQEFLVGMASEHLGEADEFEADSQIIQALSEDVRYDHELITTEETEAWLMARKMTSDDLDAYARRRYWRERLAAPIPAAASDYPGAAPEQRDLFLKELFFGNRFGELAARLGRRAVCPSAGVPPESDYAVQKEAVRLRFFQRMPMAPGELSETLRRLGRDLHWFEDLIEQESVYSWNCKQLATSENRAWMLAILRLSLTRFEIEMMDLESMDAVHEAISCLNIDGLSMEELAEQERCRIERRSVLLEHFPEELQQHFLSAESGSVLPLITSDDHFQVCRILDKRGPELADREVLARVDAEIITGHFKKIVSEHITWLIDRDPTA